MRIHNIILLASVFLVTGCMGTRTLYGPHGSRGGYSEGRVADDVQVVRFSANALTRKDTAALFSRFRAIEICNLQEKIARILGLDDKSTSQTVQRSSSYNWTTPPNYSGTAYSRTEYNNHGANTITDYTGTASGGDSYGETSTWNETYQYPVVDTYFTCVEKVYLAELALKPIPAEDLKGMVKDLLGGMQVIEFREDSPNRNKLRIGDIVLKVNGERVTNLAVFSNAINRAPNKEKIKFSLLREGRQITVTGEALDATEYTESINNEVIAAACTVNEIRRRPICSDRQPAANQ